jgi:8-oxo-dGTP diphosphatase
LSDPLKAAGGLVVRDGCVLVVHRPRYDDWSFPKGKLEDGESWEEAALREVEEETGLRCELGPYAGSTHYPFREGTKEVRYFRMTAAGDAEARNEVDAVRWVQVEEADGILSYDYDRELAKSLR